MKPGRGASPAGRRASLLVRIANEARRSGVPARRIHLVVAIDRFLGRLLVAAPTGSWAVKGGYANQLRRPEQARFTEDLDLKIDATIEAAPTLVASGFATDLGDDLSYETAAPSRPLEGPPGGGIRFVIVARLAGAELVRFKVDVSAADVVVGELEEHLSDPALERLGFPRSRFPVYPVAQHVAEKFHALTLPRAVENTRARDLVDLVWFAAHFTFHSDTLIDACTATFMRRATHPWPPPVPTPPASWATAYGRWRRELALDADSPVAATERRGTFFGPVFEGRRGLAWEPENHSWRTAD